MDRQSVYQYGVATVWSGGLAMAAAWKTVRIFIESTFRDMQAERDHLVRFVFPRLREELPKRRIHFVEVDLRWGITTEQAAEGEVLPLCLGEIHRCRPYFIGLLGERYGWVPESIPADLLESQAWLKRHLQHSVTELEILHGVFSDKRMPRFRSSQIRPLRSHVRPVVGRTP